ELFARPAFTYEHDGRRRRRNPGQLVVQDLHARRTAQDPAETTEFAQLFAQLTDFMLQRRSLLGMAQNGLDAVQVRRLDQIVAGARSQGSNGAIDRRVARDDNHLGGLWLVQLTDELDTLAIRQAEVRQQHIGTLAPELDSSLTDAVRPGNCKAFH